MKREYKIVMAFLFLTMLAGSGAIPKLIDSSDSDEAIKYGSLILLLFAISLLIGYILHWSKANISFDKKKN